MFRFEEVLLHIKLGCVIARHISVVLSSGLMGLNRFYVYQQTNCYFFTGYKRGDKYTETNLFIAIMYLVCKAELFNRFTSGNISTTSRDYSISCILFNYPENH
jgi:hypothetical protein